jgi:hypothetical protein
MERIGRREFKNFVLQVVETERLVTATGTQEVPISTKQITGRIEKTGISFFAQWFD